jgi:hypothetical protein
VCVDQFVFSELTCRPLTWLRDQDVFGYYRRMNATHADIQLFGLQALLQSARRPSAARPRPGLPEKTTTLDALRGALNLSKSELRNEHSELQSVHPGLLRVTKTRGGSTGRPVTLFKTRSAIAWELAATGVGIGDRQARFCGVALEPKSRSKASREQYVLAEPMRKLLGGSMHIEVTRTGHIERERSGKVALWSDFHNRPGLAFKGAASLQRCAE